MMAQYLSIKRQNPNCLLFYRMGDFYELFFDDAIKAAAALDITLTKRGKHKSKDIPMCGVPAHSHETYLLRLIKAGFKVAICEQTETPEDMKIKGLKGPLKREVVRVITPGTIIEDNLLESKTFNFLGSLFVNKNNFSISWVDVSTGLFLTNSFVCSNDIELKYKIENVLAMSYFSELLVEKDFDMNTEFRIKWPRGQAGSLPQDQEQFMMIEDLYRTTDRLNKQIDSMMNNRVNIEFLQKQMEKVLSDIEKLKDANREIHYKNGTQ